MAKLCTQADVHSPHILLQILYSKVAEKRITKSYFYSIDKKLLPEVCNVYQLLHVLSYILFPIYKFII